MTTASRHGVRIVRTECPASYRDPDVHLRNAATAAFRLGAGEVHTWCARLNVAPETSARLHATLSVDERNRCARFRFEQDQQRFIAAHGVLRELLGRYLGAQPGRIRYVYNTFGKPDLDPEFGDRLKFNLSHSAGLALIAVAENASVGVDLEYIETRPDYTEVAQQFFSADETDQLSAVSSHLYAEAFMRCWTKKEAYVKACGDGLAIALNSFSVPLAADPAQNICVNDIAPARRWSFHTLQPAPGYIGALVIEGSGWRVSQSHWQWQ